MKILKNAVCLSIALLCVSCSHSKKKNLEVIESEERLSTSHYAFPLLVAPDQYLGTVAAFLQSAQHSISIYQNELNDRKFVAQLIDVKNEQKSHAKFKIHLYYTRATPSLLSKLKKAGFLDEKSTNANFTLSKVLPQADYILVDAHKILTGSIAIAQQKGKAENGFELLIDSSVFGRVLGASRATNTVLNDREVFMYLDQSFFKGLKQFLGQVEKGGSLTCSIDLFDGAALHGTKPSVVVEDLVRLLTIAQSSGEKVRLILDSSNTAYLSQNKKVAQILTKDGVTDISWAPKRSKSMNFCVKSSARGSYRVVLGTSQWSEKDLNQTLQLNWQIDDEDGVISKPLLKTLESRISERK